MIGADAPGEQQRQQGGEHADADPQGAAAPDATRLSQTRDHGVAQMPGGLLQHAHHPVGALDLHLVDAGLDLLHVLVALAFQPFARLFVLHRQGDALGIDAIEAPGGQAVLRQRALPGGHHFLRIVFPRGVVDLIEDVEELRRVGAVHRVCHQVLQGVAHGAGLGMARIEQHQHQIRQIHDVIDDEQGGGALLIGIEPGGIDEDLAAQCLGLAGLELQVRIHAAALAVGDFLDLAADLVEREARVAVQRQPWQDPALFFGAIADHGEAVVHRLVAGALQLGADVLVEKGRFAGRKSAEHGDHRPPGDVHGVGVVVIQQTQPPGDVIELLKTLHRPRQHGVFLFQMLFEALDALLGGGRGHGARSPWSVERFDVSGEAAFPERGRDVPHHPGVPAGEHGGGLRTEA